MKPTLEDVLFLNNSFVLDTDLSGVEKFVYMSHKEMMCKKNMAQFKSYQTCVKTLINGKVSDEAMAQMVIDDLKGKNYPGYVKYFKSNYKESLDKSMKNAHKSVEARIRGNDLFTKETHDIQAHKDIWKMYTRSIAFAPVGSKELLLAYECRSNLLLHLKKYDDCVRDINRALDITEFPPLNVKLLTRKMTCFVEMNKNINEKKDLWTSIKEEFEKIDGVFKDDKFLKMVKQAKTDSSSQPITEIKKAKERTPTTLITFPNIALEHNKDMRIVANRDFVPGEEVIVTKPLISSVNPDKFYAYCSHCFSFMWAGIPCHECSLCMYCSEECKTEAWDKYHSLECKILPHINFDDTMYFYLQMSVKIFLIGVKEFGCIAKLKEEINNINDNPKLVQNDKLFNSDFLNFYITPYECANNTGFVSTYAKNACFLVAYLIQTCDIFEQDFKSTKGKELSTNKNIVFCCSLMLKILISCLDNYFIADPIYAKKLKYSKVVSDRVTYKLEHSWHRGTIFQSFEGMIEKSCNPNVARYWTDDGKMIYLCVQPIKKMDKISIAGNCEFFYIERTERLPFRGLKIVCRCDACEKTWPSMSGLYKKFKQRQSKSENKETELVQKYLKKNDMKMDELVEKNWAFNDAEFQELAKDVNDVVKVCGQPAFASSLLIFFLCTVYEKMHGTIPLKSHIPKD